MASARSSGKHAPEGRGQKKAGVEGGRTSFLKRLATSAAGIARRVRRTPMEELSDEAAARAGKKAGAAERDVQSGGGAVQDAAGRKRRAAVGACAPIVKRDAFVVLDEIRAKPEAKQLSEAKKLLGGSKPFEREGACRWLVFDAEKDAIPLLKQLVKSKDASIQEYKKALVGKLIKLGETSNETLQLAKPVLVSRDSIDGTYRFAMLEALKGNKEVRVARFLLGLVEKLSAQNEAPIRVELEYASRLILNNALAHADTDRLLRQAERRK